MKLTVGTGSSITALQVTQPLQVFAGDESGAVTAIDVDIAKVNLDYYHVLSSYSSIGVWKSM